MEYKTLNETKETLSVDINGMMKDKKDTRKADVKKIIRNFATVIIILAIILFGIIVMMINHVDNSTHESEINSASISENEQPAVAISFHTLKIMFFVIVSIMVCCCCCCVIMNGDNNSRMEFGGCLSML